MNILVVEDNEERIKWFQRRFQKHTLVIVQTAQAAIEILANNLNWDCVFLDHDLGGVDFSINGFNEQTGTEVAKFIRDRGFKNQVVIHSMNIYGSESMKSILQEAIVCPFSFLDQIIKGD